jgi:hypothetical protein
LADAWAKLDRAKSHTDNLLGQVETWLAGDRDPIAPTFRDHFDSDEGCWIFKLDPFDTCPDCWGLIAGDAIHNFRAALDYLAWQIAAAGTDPKPLANPRDVQFPIFGEPSKKGMPPARRFSEAVARNLPGAERGHVAVVERFQPYKRPDGAFWRDPLALLTDASNTDKHRRLRAVVPAYEKLVVVTDPAQQTNFIWERTKVDFERASPSDFIKPETVVIRLFGRPDGKGEPQPHFAIATEPHPTFDDTGVPVYGFFHEVGATVAQLLAEFEPLL